MALQALEITARPLPPLPVGDARFVIPTLSDVLAARSVISRFLPETPVVSSEALSDRLGFDVFFKCENVLPTGAFKVRGGLNLLGQLPTEVRARGVVTASTGNHGQSIAFAARAFGVPATIYVPVGANPIKVEAMRRFGAEVVFDGIDFDQSREASYQRAERDGAYFVHNANEQALIAGVGTYVLEMLEHVPDLDYLFVPAGGGSGLSAACIVGKAINPKLQVIGVQATGAPVMVESWKRRELVSFDRMETFAEGVATRVAFELPSHIIWDRVDGFRLVSDSEMRKSIVTILENARMVAEGAGAASLAGAAQMREELAGKKVGCVISGGNSTTESLKQALAEERSW
jgi:threonine dehydratase